MRRKLLLFPSKITKIICAPPQETYSTHTQNCLVRKAGNVRKLISFIARTCCAYRKTQILPIQVKQESEEYLNAPKC